MARSRLGLDAQPPSLKRTTIATPKLEHTSFCPGLRGRRYVLMVRRYPGGETCGGAGRRTIYSLDVLCNSHRSALPKPSSLGIIINDVADSDTLPAFSLRVGMRFGHRVCVEPLLCAKDELRVCVWVCTHHHPVGAEKRITYREWSFCARCVETATIYATFFLPSSNS